MRCEKNNRNGLFYEETFQGRMYFDLPFCVKSVKSVKRVTLNVKN